LRRKLIAAGLSGWLGIAVADALDAKPETPPAAQVTILSTMLADSRGIGEWGFAALVEVGSYRLLFDTGARPETVLRNAEEMGVDLSDITDVVLSHNHGDHTGGLLTLRRALAAKKAAALSRAHAAPGIFLPRRRENLGEAEANAMIAVRASYEAAGGSITEHPRPVQLAEGVWLTGPVERVHPERNFPKGGRVVTAQGPVEDTIPEDQSLVVRTRDGLLVVTGCGHAGIGNILAKARAMVPGVPVKAVIGGLHLLEADEPTLAWTAGQMRDAGVTHLVGAHCTGLESLYRLRALLGLERKSAVVGAVGARYSTSAGIDPGWLAR
jgi:7,8-dihydropterin-6-yl-methyl-4-(beta-D-ribofuranosyl)aminobenzene 5'-phosphate synthase